VVCCQHPNFLVGCIIWQFLVSWLTQSVATNNRSSSSSSNSSGSRSKAGKMMTVHALVAAAREPTATGKASTGSSSNINTKVRVALMPPHLTC